MIKDATFISVVKRAKRKIITLLSTNYATPIYNSPPQLYYTFIAVISIFTQYDAL